MDSYSQDGEVNKKITEVQPFQVQFALGEFKEKITINTNTPLKPSKEKIIRQAFKLHSLGNIHEAKKYYQYFLDLGFKDPGIINNYAILCKQLVQIDQSIKLFRK